MGEKEKLERTVRNLQQCLAANDSSLAKGLALLHEKLEWSRPMPLGYAHEPPDVGTRSRPGLAVGVL